MPYYVGIDLGTTYTAAAVWRDGRVEIATLGTRAAVVPSVVLFREDGTVLVGEAAERRALTEPQRVAREFKRRFGDSTPIIVGGTPYSADALSAKLLRWVIDAVSEREGGPPASVVVSHPANWGPYKKELLDQVFRQADVDEVTTISEPEAAAIHYASQERIDPGATIAVYDLGGGTFDAALLRRSADGWAILGEPEGIERLGGVDFDEAVFHHVEVSLSMNVLDALDPDDPSAMAALARLRQECVEAKEALSGDVDATIPVLLPNVQADVRLTRSELEDMIRPALADSIAALRRALRSAGIEAEAVTSVLLVGGSSRLPLVAQLVSSELRRPVAVDAHPKHAVALGAAIVAAERGHGRSVDTEVVPSIEIMEVGATSFASRSAGDSVGDSAASIDPVDLSGPVTVPVVPVVPLPTPTEPQPVVTPPRPPAPAQQRVTVPAPPPRRAASRPEPSAPAPRRPATASAPAAAPSPQRQRAQPRRTKGRRSRAPFVLLAVVALAGAFAGAYLWADGQNDDNDNSDGGGVEARSDTTEGVISERTRADATQKWNDTSIDLEAGDTVTVTASGEIRDDIERFPERTFTPDGVEDPEGLHAGDPFAGDFNHAALLGRIGTDGEVFLLGASREFSAEDSGRLFVGVHDNFFEDNDGTFTVDVTVTPG